MTGTVRSLRVVGAAVLTAALAAGMTAPVAAEMDAALAEELVAIEQSKLEPWYGEASTAAYVADISEDATYFDPWAPSKQYGPAVVEYLQGFEGNIPPLGFEITDPSVDVRGDVAIFTYNVENFDQASGEPTGLWMVTKVMNRTDDGWEVIHIHYGAPLPPPEALAEE
jgi:ketosteroid isomerase-like protein